jgi:ABC-type cobalamin/Fe3+-siderophores transport system ATPase subunit
MLLAQEARFLLPDEPSSALDPARRGADPAGPQARP